ncbi:KIAA1430-like protein-domain-containing protein [Baffinella frigidus]|nr:KIAA1430-like protein-domain-containing protein [Cryptophyta sp. CCMP2293]
MYAYRKAMPRLNKHLDEKWVKHCQQMHRKRLKQMKPAIDNKPPPKYVHLVQNLKKQQMDEERYSQIERDNYLLLDKMSYIMTHPQLLDEKYMGPPVTFGKSLNKEYRKRELMRITEENLQILRRIQHKEPYYNHLEWEEESRRAEEYLRNCAEYPIVLPSARGSTARQSGGFTREPGLIKSTPAPLQVRIKGKGQSTLSAAEGGMGEESDDQMQMGADRSQLQSRGSSRDARMQQTMPKVEEEEDAP